MAQHRAQSGKHRAPTQPRRILSRDVSGYVGAWVLALSVLALLVSLYVAGSKAEDAPATMAGCITEDGSDRDQAFPCVWNAPTMGNGEGSSFILTSAN